MAKLVTEFLYENISESTVKIHPSKLPNAEGNYPYWSGHKKIKFDPIEACTAVLALLRIPYTGKALRIITDGINNYLERSEGYHYGVSAGFTEATTMEGVIVEHGIPLKVLIEMMLRKIKTNEISKPEDVLNFIKKYYTVCLITPAEDARLRSLKLGHKMPKNWSEWAERYKRAGIVLVQFPGNK